MIQSSGGKRIKSCYHSCRIPEGGLREFLDAVIDEIEDSAYSPQFLDS